MERAHAQWAHDQPPHTIRTQRSLELRLLRALDQPPRKYKDDRARVEPPQGEPERTRRRRVEPLDVVDGDQNRSAVAQKLQPIVHGDGKRPAIDGIARRLLPEQRDLKRAPPRWQ